MPTRSPYASPSAPRCFLPKVDKFVPRTHSVNLRTVCQPDLRTSQQARYVFFFAQSRQICITNALCQLKNSMPTRSPNASASAPWCALCRCRAKMSRIRQSRPDSGFDFGQKSFKRFQVLPLRSEVDNAKVDGFVPRSQYVNLTVVCQHDLRTPHQAHCSHFSSYASILGDICAVSFLRVLVYSVTYESG